MGFVDYGPMNPLSGIRVVPSWHYWTTFWENSPFPWQPSPKYERL